VLRLGLAQLELMHGICSIPWGNPPSGNQLEAGHAQYFMRKFYILFRWKHPTWNSTEALGDPLVAKRGVGAKLSQTLSIARLFEEMEIYERTSEESSVRSLFLLRKTT